MTNNSSESNKNSDSAFNKNMTIETPRTRMETAHLLCDSDNFEDIISTLKKEGEELERELDASKAEVERLRQLLLVSDLPVALVNSHYNPTTEESSAEVEELKALNSLKKEIK